MTFATGMTPSRLLGCTLLAAFAAYPAFAQTPDPNAIDTGNFTAPPPSAAQALAHQLASLAWIFGPETIPVGTTATIAIPNGYEMLQPPDAEKFLQLNGNTVTAADANDEILQNEDPDSGWFAVIQPESGGHIADTDTLDQSALLATMQNAAAKDTAAPSTLTGWAVPPNYDHAGHRLEWALTYKLANGGQSAPLNVRILGRTADIKITVVDDPTAITNDVADVNKALAGLSFNQSQTYADYAQGDATAPYGLAGLVEGASAAAGTLPPPPPVSHTGTYIIFGAIGALVLALAGLVGWRARK